MESPTDNKKTTRRTMNGVVVAKSGQKTVKIEVVRYLQHPLYRKQVRRTKRYLIHDPLEKCQVGETIEVQECRPISRSKRWQVLYTPEQKAK